MLNIVALFVSLQQDRSRLFWKEQRSNLTVLVTKVSLLLWQRCVSEILILWRYCRIQIEIQFSNQSTCDQSEIKRQCHPIIFWMSEQLVLDFTLDAGWHLNSQMNKWSKERVEGILKAKQRIFHNCLFDWHMCAFPGISRPGRLSGHPLSTQSSWCQKVLRSNTLGCLPASQQTITCAVRTQTSKQNVHACRRRTIKTFGK